MRHQSTGGAALSTAHDADASRVAALCARWGHEEAVRGRISVVLVLQAAMFS
jgi:hypothetical protein